MSKALDALNELLGLDDPEADVCTFCKGPLVPIGQLGHLDWFRCRWCGLDQHREHGGES